MRQDLVPQRLEIGLARFDRRKTQRRQPTRRVIDEHDQRAARPAPLEPVVRAAVDLHQLAEPRPPLAQLKHPLHPPPLRTPQPKRNLQPTHRLRRDLDPVPFQQLLRRQPRAEIRIRPPQQLPDPHPKRLAQPPMRQPPALARHQTGVAVAPPGTHQSLELAHADAQPLRGLALAHPVFHSLTHQTPPIALRRAHRKNPLRHPSPATNQAQKGTFSCWPEGTFLCWANTSLRPPVVSANTVLPYAPVPSPSPPADRASA